MQVCISDKNSINEFKEQLINDIWHGMHLFAFVGIFILYLRFQQIGATYSMLVHASLISFIIAFHQFCSHVSAKTKAICAGITFLLVGIPSTLEFGFYGTSVAWFLMSLVVFLIYQPSQVKYVFLTILVATLVSAYRFVILKQPLPFDANHFIFQTEGWLSSLFAIITFLMCLKYTFHRSELVKQLVVEDEQQTVAPQKTITAFGIGDADEFKSNGDNEFVKYRDTYEPFTVLMVEVDQLSQITETFGQTASEKVLQNIAKTLKLTVKECKMKARLVEEGFELLLSNTDFHSGRIIAERVRNTISTSQPLVEGSSIYVTASIGMACVRGVDNSFDDVLKRADMGVYNAKNLGKNCVFYS